MADMQSETTDAAGGTLASAPLRIQGRWGDARMQDVRAVLEETRLSALMGMSPPTMGIPSEIVVIGDPDADASTVRAESGDRAMMTLRMKGRFWAAAAYQFSHQFGHVITNGWDRSDGAAGPSQWLEEALVEAVALINLQRMSVLWHFAPPYPHWDSHGETLARYAKNRLAELRAAAPSVDLERDGKTWFRDNEADLATLTDVDDLTGGLVAWLVAELRSAPGVGQSIPALNRWEERTALPVPDYLAAWSASCAELGAPDTVPRRLAACLG